ncbi:MAG: AAA family ATPase [Candidatus Micrarchaeota archaeon]
MIIGITGLARSGKDTAAVHIAERYNFTHLDLGRDGLIPEAEKRGLETDKRSLSIFADELRQEGGMAIVAKLLLEKMKEEKNYIVTGFRSPEEVDLIRNEASGDFYLIEVHADKLERYARRTDKDPQDVEEFFERDRRDMVNKGLDKVLKMADFKILNEGTLEELYENADKVVEKIMEM